MPGIVAGCKAMHNSWRMRAGAATRSRGSDSLRVIRHRAGYTAARGVPPGRSPSGAARPRAPARPRPRAARSSTPPAARRRDPRRRPRSSTPAAFDLRCRPRPSMAILAGRFDLRRRDPCRRFDLRAGRCDPVSEKFPEMLPSDVGHRLTIPYPVACHCHHYQRSFR